MVGVAAGTACGRGGREGGWGGRWEVCGNRHTGSMQAQGRDTRGADRWKAPMVACCVAAATTLLALCFSLQLSQHSHSGMNMVQQMPNPPTSSLHACTHTPVVVVTNSWTEKGSSLALSAPTMMK